MNADGEALRVLIVEDDLLIQTALVESVEGFGCVVSGVAETARDAVAMALNSAPDLILMDVRLRRAEDGDGIDAALQIRAAGDTRIIFVTANHDAELADRMGTVDGATVLIKPVWPATLREAITGEAEPD
jgi:CheY-like chemotaxis protein